MLHIENISGGEAMKVVLDSGVFVRNFQMSSPSFETFLNHHAATGHQFVMLDIVFDEIINKYQEILYQQKRDIDSGLEEIRKQTRKEFTPPVLEDDISSLCKEYEKYLRKKLTQFKALPCEYPGI